MSLPHRLRYVLAWDHALCRAVTGVFVLGTIDRRVHRLLGRRGVRDDPGKGSAADPWREEAPVLAGIAGASVQGRRALGAPAGAAVRRCDASAELLALAPSGRGPRARKLR